MAGHSSTGSVSLHIVPASAVRELASGIDSLYLSGRGNLSPEFVASLSAAKERAVALREAVPFLLGGVEFGLAPHGWGRYPFRLSHRYGLVGFTGSEHLPAVRIQPRAEFLHGVGAEATADQFQSLLWSVGEFELSVSRVDLFADVQGWTVDAEHRHNFVSRAKSLVTFEEDGGLTGLQFGRRRGGGLSARIYDKSAHARKKGDDWWPEVWGESYDASRPVLRVEFEFGRTILRQVGIDSPEDLFEKMGPLWAYGTEDWLSLRIPTHDRTGSRWPVAREWEVIQGVSLRGDAVGVKRTTDAGDSASLRRLVAPLCGYLASVGVVRGAASLSECLGIAGAVIRDYERDTGIPFEDRLEKKRHRRGWGL